MHECSSKIYFLEETRRFIIIIVRSAIKYTTVQVVAPYQAPGARVVYGMWSVKTALGGPFPSDASSGAEVPERRRERS